MIEQVNIANGIKIYSILNPNLKSFCLSLYIRAGSIFEEDFENGISHLFEHTVFRNLKRKYPKFYELLAFHGLDFQGSTYKEFIRFTLSGPYYELDFALDVLCSLFDKIELNPADFVSEKKRIKAEIREADERNSLDFFFNNIVWENTQAQKTVLGYCKVIDRISVKKLNEFREKILTKNNFFIYATGNISKEGIDKTAQKLALLNVGDSEWENRNVITVSNEFFNRDGKIKVKDDKWHYIEIGFDIDTSKFSGGTYDLLYAILFSGDIALVHNYLSEDNPIMYSFSSTHEQYDNIGNLNFKFEVDKDMILAALNIVVDMLNAVKRGEFNYEANLKAELCSIELEADDPDDFNWSMAYNNHILKTDPVNYAQEKFGRFKNVSKEQVIQAACEIFKTRNMTVAIKGKKKKIKTEELEKVFQKLEKVND